MNKKRYLFDLIVQKISLVREPANRRKFFLVKRAKGGDVIVTEELKKMVTRVFGEEKAEDYIAIMETKSEDELAEISKSIETLSACADDLPEDLQAAISAVVTSALEKNATEVTSEADVQDVAEVEDSQEEDEATSESDSTEEAEAEEDVESPAEEQAALGERIDNLETEIQGLKKAISEHSMKEEFEKQLETLSDSIGDLKECQKSLSDRVEKMAGETTDETSIGAEETRKSSKKTEETSEDWTTAVFDGVL